ncbi:ATP-dependent helicase [Candidatus Peribacteria bacterium]|nr:ATP-dependent helicase [Candidatus Peribacteria bacterium]
MCPLRHHDRLQQLNPAQRAAVEHTEGPVLVVAGPGTGKTHLLTMRIAQILQTTDAQPSALLCLTFTDTGASEMQERLQQWIGTEAHRVGIFTFHGFAAQVMETYPEYFPQLQSAPQLADSIDQAQCYTAAVEALGTQLQQLRPWGDPHYWRVSAMQAISQLRREGVTPASLQSAIAPWRELLRADPERHYKRNYQGHKKGDIKPGALAEIDEWGERVQDLSLLWQGYTQQLRDRNLYDYDELLLWVVEAIERTPTLQSLLQERYQYLLVDEYQDTNSVQNTLLWQLSDFWAEPNLFVVGDDDQAIYRFQGASVANIQAFQQRFPHAKKITLSENYRSRQGILDAAEALICQNPGRLSEGTALVASGSEARATVTAVSVPTPLQQWQQVVQYVQQSGQPLSHTAVIVRSNAEVRECSQYCAALGIPTQSPAAADLLSFSVITEARRLLRSLISSTSWDFMASVQLPHWRAKGVTPLLLYWLTAERPRDMVFMKWLLEGNHEHPLQPVQDVFIFLRELEGRTSAMTAFGQARLLLIESGFTAYLAREANPERVRDLHLIEALLQYIKRYPTLSLSEVLERLEQHQTLREPVPVHLPHPVDALHIMTAHKAKGLEFPTVILPNLHKGMWEHRRSGGGIALPPLSLLLGQPVAEDTADHTAADDRRLLYVAMTRAKSTLHLLYSATDDRQKTRLPSPMLSLFSVTPTEPTSRDSLTMAALGVTTPLYTTEESAYLQTLVGQFRWSPSSLQSFIEAPETFFTERLLRVPLPPSKHFALGTALHRALEVFLRTVSQHKAVPPLEALLQSFREEIAHQPLTQSEMEHATAEGIERLSQYYTAHQGDFPGEYLLEQSFRRYHLQAEGVPIDGKIDMIRVDRRRNSCTVTDYKSGSAQKITPPQHLGDTADGTGYWRQLVFYDLLVRLSPLPYQVTACQLQFLRPEKNGIFPLRALTVQESDRAHLIAELQACHAKLLALDFTPLSSSL